MSNLADKYPGLADKINSAYEKGYTDEMIEQNIQGLIGRAEKAGYSDSMINNNLYGRRVMSLRQRAPTFFEKAQDYLGLEWKPPDLWDESDIERLSREEGKTKFQLRQEIFGTGKEKELAAVISRGLAGLSGGVTDYLMNQVDRPETTPGVLAGAGLEFAGFMFGPFKAARGLTGTRLAPTAAGLRGVSQTMIQGGATLGLASSLSQIIPALRESNSLTEAGGRIIESGSMGALVGMLFPLSGVVPTKTLRVATGLAVMDKIRAGFSQWFTVDDVVKGIKDGNIDSKELGEAAFGYALDLYFLSRVPSMKQQLVGLENAVVKRMLEIDAKEAEKVITEIGERDFISEADVGAGKGEKEAGFGSEKEFNDTYNIVRKVKPKVEKPAPKEVLAEYPELGGREPPPTGEKPPTEPPSKGEPPSQKKLENAAKVEDMHKETDLELARLKKGRLRRAGRAVARATLDTAWNVKRKLIEAAGELGLQAKMRHDAVGGAIPKAHMALREIYQTIYGDLSKTDQLRLNHMIQSRRTVAIDKYKEGMKHPKDLNGEAHQDYLDVLKEVEPEVFVRLSEKADLYFAEMRKQLDALRDNKLITDEDYQRLAEKGDYSPREFIQYIDPVRMYTIEGTKSSVPDSGLKALKEGSEQLLQNDSMLLLNEVITRTESRIARNKAHKALWDIADQVPDNGMVRKAKGIIRKVKGEEGAKGAKVGQVVNALDRDNYGKIISMDKETDKYKVRFVSKEGATATKDFGSKDLIFIYRKGKAAHTIPTEYEKAPPGQSKISLVIDGKHKELVMETEMAKEWLGVHPKMPQQLANIIGWVSGSKMLKAMATGINPEFALTNFPRDIAHSWFVTDEFSPHIPVASLQYAKQLAKTAKDAWTNTERAIDFVNEGGGLEYLTHQGQFRASALDPAIENVQTVLGHLGEFSERWVRLAIREQALANGRQPHEATWIARSYMDFGQSGWFTKALDSGVPYLNAGVVGTRGIFRAFGERPMQSAYKVAQLGVLSSGLYLANKTVNPEALDMIPDYEKTSNFIITTPLSYIDEDGNKRYYYLRIAKDQGQRLICTAFESLMGKFMGDEIDVDQIVDALKEAFPIMPDSMLPPILDAILGYQLNKDFWRNEDIWKGSEVESYLEKTHYIHPAFVEWGEATGMSPKRTQYVLQQYFTSGNIYTSLVGGGMKALMGQLSEEDMSTTTTQLMYQTPFMRKILRVTNPNAQYKKTIEKARIKENSRRFVQNFELSKLAEDYYKSKEAAIPNLVKTTLNKKKVNDFINSQLYTDRKRLRNRFNRFGKLRGIPDRRWWIELSRIQSPEAKATLYWTRYETAKDNEKKRLEKYLRKVPGVTSQRFYRRLNSLKNRMNGGTEK